MQRPASNPNNRHDYAKKIWADAERRKEVERIQENEVFHLSPKEAKKCRYEIINQSERMAECTVHTGGFSHGVRMFPPHLYDLRNGKVYFRQSQKSEWIEWSANVSENKQRLNA